MKGPTPLLRLKLGVGDILYVEAYGTVAQIFMASWMQAYRLQDMQYANDHKAVVPIARHFAKDV